MIAAAHEPRVKLSALLGGHFDFAAACFHLLQRGERIKVFGYVCVKDIAVMFGHVQSGVPQKSLQGKRIPATINKIFSGECVPLRYNKDKREKPVFSMGLSVCRSHFNSFSNIETDAKI